MDHTTLRAHVRERAREILDTWFATLDDASELDREREPFRTCYAHWYGKSAEVDDRLRARFGGELERVTSAGARWTDELDAWASVPDGLLALTVLLDQLPRNIHRGHAQMYAHDALGLHVATLAIHAYELTPVALVRRMFLYVPLMHVEDRTVQHAMVARFEELARRAETVSPQNAGFFGYALGSARRHADVIDRFGRFPHRNAILGRASTEAELVYLAEPDAGF